jgi:NADH pyrophosphatase NudC (nudix superfamily)
VEAERLILQESEVEEVRWFDLEEVWEELDRSSERFCVPKQSLGLLRDWLAAAQ